MTRSLTLAGCFVACVLLMATTLRAYPPPDCQGSEPYTPPNDDCVVVTGGSTCTTRDAATCAGTRSNGAPVNSTNWGFACKGQVVASGGQKTATCGPTMVKKEIMPGVFVDVPLTILCREEVTCYKKRNGGCADAIPSNMIYKTYLTYITCTPVP